MRHDHPHKYAQNAKNHGGNAIVIILVIIVLLAALTAVAMRSSNRTSSNMDTETARIQAEKLIRAAQNYESNVRKLLSLNRCAENEVSFLNTVTTLDYTNPKSPTDKHCHIFELAGAGMAYTNPNATILDTSNSALSDYGQWVFKSTQCILGVGSDDDNTCADSEIALIAAVPHISLPICLQINSLSGVTNPAGAPPEESFDETGSAFSGDFIAGTGAEIGDSVTGTNLVGHTTGCFKTLSGAWTNSYIFYHVLYAR